MTELIGECRCVDCGRENSPTWVCPGCQKKRDERWKAEQQKPAGMTDKHADIRERLAQHDFAKTLVNPSPRPNVTPLHDPYEDVRRLLDEVEQQRKRIEIIVKVESKLHKSEMEKERLRKALEEIARAESMSITHDIGYMQHIARKALEGTE